MAIRAFSTDPELEAKVRDVAGLYLSPPDNVVVVSVDFMVWLTAYSACAWVNPLEHEDGHNPLLGEIAEVARRTGTRPRRPSEVP